MAASKPAEKASRKRRSLPGMLIGLMVNIFLMSVLVWFLLLVGFGCYRLTHADITVYRYLQAIARPNVNFLQESRLFQVESYRWQRWFKGISNQALSNPGLNSLEDELKIAKHRLPNLQEQIQNRWQKLKREIMPIIRGVTGIVGMRILALALAIPLFLLCLSVGLVDGLVQRDIRRFQVARESALLFHELKRSSGFWFYVPLFAYLIVPIPISPQWFLLPLAIGLGVLVQLSTKSFKKYI